MFIVNLLLKTKFEDKFEYLELTLSPAVHGEMVPGGGGFHVHMLHEA